MGKTSLKEIENNTCRIEEIYEVDYFIQTMGKEIKYRKTHKYILHQGKEFIKGNTKREIPK